MFDFCLFSCAQIKIESVSALRNHRIDRVARYSLEDDVCSGDIIVAIHQVLLVR